MKRQRFIYVDEQYLMPVKRLLLERRREIGMTRKELSAGCNFNESQLRSWEKTLCNPSLINFLEWVDVLGLDLELALKKDADS